MNLEDVFDDFEDEEPSDHTNAFDRNILEHLFSMRLSSTNRTNLLILRDRANDQSLKEEERAEALKWLHKIGEETVEHFKHNIFITVLINGRKVCNMSVCEDDKEDVVRDMATHIPPVMKLIGNNKIKKVVYKPLKSLNIIVELEENE